MRSLNLQIVSDLRRVNVVQRLCVDDPVSLRKEVGIRYVSIAVVHWSQFLAAMFRGEVLLELPRLHLLVMDETAPSSGRSILVAETLYVGVFEVPVGVSILLKLRHDHYRPLDVRILTLSVEQSIHLILEPQDLVRVVKAYVAWENG